MSEDVLRIKKQGTYSAGGTVQKAAGKFDPFHGQLADAGQIRHSDHANVFYQIPEDGNGKRVMFLHGYGGNQNAWQSTEYAEGWADMFLNAGYETYNVDQPRYGHASQSSANAELPARPDDLTWYTQFRLGQWPKFNDGTQFPVSDYNIDQFFRYMNPSVGAFDVKVITDALAAALERSGEATLITHSQGGIPGWFIGAASDKVTGVVAIEPGTFVFPEDECPDPVPTKSAFGADGKFGCIPIVKEQFESLIKKPIVVYFGDFIPSEPSDLPAADHWRVVLELSRQFCDTVNKHGGNAKTVYLPEEGIHGNSHFMFQEKNNREIFDHLLKWMKENNL